MGDRHRFAVHMIRSRNGARSTGPSDDIAVTVTPTGGQRSSRRRDPPTSTAVALGSVGRAAGSVDHVLAAGAGDPSGALRQYLTIFIFASLAVLLVSLLLGISWLIRPSRKQPGKYLNYESGVDPVGQMWTQSQVRYYIFALLFVLFDVEAVFIFPWATRLETYGGFGLVEMFVFIGILVLGLVYAWRKGVLRWA